MKKIFTIILSCFTLYNTSAQDNITYQKPPKEILDLVNVQPAPSVMMDTKKEYMILRFRNMYKTLDDLNQEEMRLGGLRINPVLNISSTMTYSTNIMVQKIKGGTAVQVTGLPAQPKLANFSWSLNEKKVAFTHTTQSGVELWILDIEKALATKLTDAVLNANLGNPISWFNDNEHLLVKMLPANRPALLDAKKTLPLGPTVAVSSGSKSQNRTYQDLLKNPMDETNFETLVSSELYKVNINGAKTLLFPTNMYVGESFSPDGNYLMVSTIQKPFSYIVPYSRFPMTTKVYSKVGQLVKTVNEVPLTEIMPKGFMAVRKGKRSIGWRSDEPASWGYVVALDEGDPAKQVDFRDEVFLWKAPFDNQPVSILKTKQRFAGIEWCNEHIALASDSWYDIRNTKTYLFDPSNAAQAPKIIFDRNEQDVYSDPGNFETKKNDYGRYVIALENGNAFLVGDGFTKEGQFPFIDEYNFTSLKSKRLYQSALKDKKENILSVEDFKNGIALVQIESPADFPNYYFRNYGKKKSLSQITSFPNPFESIKDVYKEVIKYQRKDGVALNGTLYLPKGYDRAKKEKLPLLIWAYPEEFKDKASAGQTKSNPNEFTFPNYGSFVY